MSSSTLDSFCNFQKGFAFKSSDYVDKGTKIVRVSDLNAYDITLNSCISISDASSYETYRLKEDDVIIATVGSWETNPMSVVGKVVRVQSEASNSLLNQNAVRVRAKDTSDQKFLFYLLKNRTFKEYIISTARGSASQASITQESIKNFNFNLPDKPYREKTVEILTALDRKIAANNKRQMILEFIVLSIYKSWFNDFNYPNATGELENGIPKGWERSNVFERVIEVKEKNIDHNDYPVLSVVKEGEFKPSEDVFTKQVYSKSTSNYKIVKRNQVGYNPARANIGSIAMLMDFEVGLVSPIYIVFEMKSSITPTFFYYYMKQPIFLENIKHHAIGTTRQNLSFEAFKMFEMIVPPKPLQERFEEIAKPIEQKIAKLKEENSLLSEIRDALLPKLMSGELPVEVGNV
ncbi:restriction endonuclease subunit S [Paenibacillus sp. MZ04-78.2]|uniref:restriction endonuclease subunit S n=1 Tax=Paenibacillus sp. MZ04-78.2 TaxID=2962034 RepID=UPI0020B878C8|nr:restriction endonuclease subunit S [Paenibacillus sp. MZ04-78.2]